MLTNLINEMDRRFHGHAKMQLYRCDFLLLRLDPFVVFLDEVNQTFHGLDENSPAVYGWVANGKPKQVPQGTAESFVPAGTRRFVGRRTQH